MNSKTLEQYLVAAIERGQIDHALRAHRGLDGKITFYVLPLNGYGETLDFVVRGNGLALNLTSDSDVPVSDSAPIESSYNNPHPVHQAVDLGHAIAKLAPFSDINATVNGLIKTMAGKATDLLGGPIAVAGPAQISILGDNVEVATTGSVTVTAHQA